MEEKNIFSSKVITIDAEAGVLQAKAKMTSHNIRHLPVVDAENRIVGILSDRDLRSVLPYRMDQNSDVEPMGEKLSAIRVSEVMTPDPHTISETFTLQGALLQFQRFNVGAFPVIDENRRVVGIVSYRDLLKMFIHFLGVEQPGSFLAVTTRDEAIRLQELVDRICGEKIPIASMLVKRNWQEGRSAVFLYLLTKDVGRVRKIVSDMGGYTLLNPLQWFLRQFDPEHLPSSMAV